MRVEFYKHSLGNDEKASVLECLDGLFLTTGSYVEEFERQFAEYLTTPYAVGLSSCTAALHLALLALGIGKGDEVITTPMTFIATATAIMHTGAKPVFVDVEEGTGLLDPANVESLITDRTKAIIPVHLYGQMCDMYRISDIAKRYTLAVIEDCAHCIEGERDGVKPGQLSDAACFSFYATKNITSGEGGAFITKDRELAQKVLRLRQHGMSREASERYGGKYQHWDMLECGWKYNMSNIQAALLLPQMKKIDAHWEKRKVLCSGYNDRLNGLEGVRMPCADPAMKNAHHLYTIWVDENRRDETIDRMSAAGIGVAVNYRAIHLLTFMKDRYGYKRGLYPNAERIGDQTISLPFWIKMNNSEIDLVTETLRAIINER